MALIEYSVKCPQCSAGMVLRTAKKGSNSGKQFYGCSRFPRCKGTRNLEAAADEVVKSKTDVPAIPEREQNPFIRAVSQRQVSQESTAPQGQPLTENQKHELARLRDRLLNVSSRNRSIRLNRIDKKSALDLSALSEIDNELPNEIIEHCLTQSDEVPILPPKNEDTQEVWDSISNHLIHLHRNISEIYKEKGLYDLYIGFPFLSGKPAGAETLIQAPIFLIPVHLEKTIPKKGMPVWTLKPSADTKVLFNKTLFYALSKLCNLTMNQDLFDEEAPTELYGKEHFVQWTHDLLKNYGVVAKINENSLDKEFDKVKEFTVANPPEDLVSDGLQIFQYAVLGHFPQSNSSLQKDYEAFLTFTQEDLESITCFLSEEYLDQDQEYDENSASSSFDFSGEAETESSTIDQRPEKDNFFLLPSDSSQDRIILELGKTSTDGLVVWGPPGTGKSQTIVNIISDCVAKGQTVLLVSQKRAALDVVYERLATRNMDSMVALVHDTKEDRKDLYTKISSLCHQEAQSNVEHIDPSSDIEAITKTLKDVTHLYNDSTYGKKLGHIIQALAAYKGPLLETLNPSWKEKKHDALEEMCQLLDSFESLFHPELPEILRKNRKDFSNLNFEVAQALKSLSNQIKEDVQLIQAATKLAINNGSGSGNTQDREVSEFATQLSALNSDQSVVRFLKPSYWKLRSLVSKQIQAAEATILAIETQAKKLAASFAHDTINMSLGFLKNYPSASATLHEIADSVHQNFYAIKSLDLFRNNLSPEVRALEEPIEAAQKAHSLKTDWGKILRFSVYSLWLKDMEVKHPVLSSIRSGHIDQLRARLKTRLDQKIDFNVVLLRKRLGHSLADNSGKEFARSLSTEVNRKRNIPTVRKLNEKYVASPYYKSLLPVWLVSPETVSDVFPLQKGLFDVVIFDEASQCTVENGLPAIYRGKQIVIAGDEKQLPPSRLFESTIEEDHDEESFASSEPSLLTLAKKTLRYKAMMLEWHYRSKHQELVNFSNEVFYNGKMKIAPNVIPFVKGNESAIKWHSVTGYWEDRTNREEANKVMALIEEYLSSDEPPSVGVITFNINQKNHILDLIDKRMVEDPEFAALMENDRKRPLDEQLFVKNIENVQGDERDVIIFSVAYAPAHPGGRVMQHFGLLNQSGGENRLNVAVTRAISKIHIVCSIDPEHDLNTSTSNNLGPKIFHKYLCYAKAVADENFDKIESILAELNPSLSIRPQTDHLQFDSPFEEDVFNELTLRGYELHSQVGQSGFRIDLAVVHPDDPSKYIIGIECDGAMYHSSVSVRERDVFRQRFLEGRGWTITRIWSPSWRENRQREIQRIQSLIDKILESDRKQSESNQA